METIIGLLFVLLPVIFKLIGKKLEQAGHYEQAGKVREIVQEYLEPESESGSDDQALEEIPQWLAREPETPAAAPAVEPVKEIVAREIAFDEAVPAIKEHHRIKKTPILMEEESQKENKERIDPKKLVIYSEIMKPKYQDQGLV